MWLRALVPNIILSQKNKNILCEFVGQFGVGVGVGVGSVVQNVGNVTV